MPKYQYKAVSLAGENVTGDYSAPDRDSVVNMLRQGGYYPLEIVQTAEDVARVTNKKIRIKPLAGFCAQMASMLKAGVPIAKSLEILRDQTDYEPLQKVLEDVYAKVQRGNSLFHSFLPYRENFPVIFLNILEAGEESGRLDMCLERAGVSFSRTAKLNGKVKSAMVYPTVLLTLMVAIVVLLLIFVIPAFIGIFEANNAQLPALTQFLVDLSDFVVHRWYIVLTAVIVIVVVARMWLNSKRGREAFDRFKLHIPVISKLLIRVYAARYARTLSSLNASGVPLIHALSVTARSVGNVHIEKGLYKVMEAINRGEELSAELERMGDLPPMIVYMTRLGEESGTMDQLLDQTADYYDEESDAALQVLTSLLEPLMIVFMAIIILPVILAIIMPVFGMYSTL